MKATVYHATNPTFLEVTPSNFPTGFEAVATLEVVTGTDSEALEHTFRATNHIDSNWMKNPEVRELQRHNLRSTSVGDVVILGNGSRYLCAMVGWIKF
jgi:hypothetical protein